MGAPLTVFDCCGILGSEQPVFFAAPGFSAEVAIIFRSFIF